MFESLLTLFFLLVAGHMVADFALQTEWVARYKNRRTDGGKFPDEFGRLETVWPWLLTAHSFHHGLMVFIITQKIWLGLLETAIHWIIDFCKTEKWYGFHMDQLFHISCKVLWIVLLYYKIV